MKTHLNVVAQAIRCAIDRAVIKLIENAGE
jgi:hypothetical protein